MRQLILILIICTFFSPGNASSQPPVNNTAEVLEKLYSRLVDNFDDANRLQINDSIRLIIDRYVVSDTVFNHRFSNLRYLGQITSPDSLLKIITWNLLLTSGPSRYYCYFIRKQAAGKENKIYRLTADYTEDPIVTDTIYYQNDWHGALYYDLKPYHANDNKCWILLGIDYGNPFISRKIIDVLSFTPENTIVFGKKWFASGENLKFREVFEYASNGMMSLRFSSDSSIVFDHLVPFSPDMTNDRKYYGPDYSFDAYIFKNGIWKLTVNVDARNKE
jgi:hypothetical protein